MATQQTKTNKPLRAKRQPFEAGDLVRVIEGTHDPAMPAHRTGLVVEVITVATSPNADWPAAVYMVRFGTSILKFHSMFLEKVS